MFKRKLQALGYPNYLAFNPNDDAKFRNLVTWLEDEKIRHYLQNERECLRQVKDDQWNKTFEKYLQDVGLDLVTRNIAAITDQLLSLAVGLEFGEHSDKFTQAATDKQSYQAPQIVAANPLDKLDFSSPEFIKGVNDVADLLRVTKHSNHLTTLEACAILVKTKFSKEGIKNGENVARKGAAFPFQDGDQSFQSGDLVLNQASKILRLLFIMDLRDLQTKINECIVAVQTITANPKTDTRLGKVGF